MITKTLPERQQDILLEMELKAEADYAKFSERAMAILQPGKAITWDHCGHTQVGTVVSIGRSRCHVRLLVHNRKTKREYPIYVEDYFRVEQRGLEQQT